MKKLFIATCFAFIASTLTAQNTNLFSIGNTSDDIIYLLERDNSCVFEPSVTKKGNVIISKIDKDRVLDCVYVFNDNNVCWAVILYPLTKNMDKTTLDHFNGGWVKTEPNEWGKYFNNVYYRANKRLSEDGERIYYLVSVEELK